MYMARWKVFFITVVCLAGIWFVIPNFMSKSALEKATPWIPETQVRLGLDLQGGSHILMEVDVKTFIQDYLDGLLESTRLFLRHEKVAYRQLGRVKGQDVISFTLRNGAGDLTPGLLNSLKSIDRDLEIYAEGDRVFLVVGEKARLARIRSAVDQSIEIIRRRIDETGTKEPTIQRQGEDRILVQLPGIEDPERVKNLLGQTAKLSFRFLGDSSSSSQDGEDSLPSDVERLESLSGRGDTTYTYIVKKRVVVSGESLLDAQPTFDENNRPCVRFKLDALGGRKFAEVTKENVGKSFAIILDNKVISAPTINEPIPGGEGRITGNFSVEEASDFALLLRAGALPAPLTVLEERTVGPDLGADSIRAGTQATVLAICLIVVFMVIAYAAVGFVANIALVFNLVLLFAGLSILGATLTLPGIAGIALTLGMAVDANVLINERIKEELRHKKNYMAAIDAGYNRAMSTIIDSNITTLIGSILLYIFGTGPVRGFAITLSIGILVSMFTAVSLSRLIMITWIRWRRPKTLWI